MAELRNCSSQLDINRDLKHVKQEEIRTHKPVDQISVSSSAIADQFLVNARKLCQVERFKAAFVSPARSLEQRKIQRNILKEIKGRALT